MQIVFVLGFWLLNVVSVHAQTASEKRLQDLHAVWRESDPAARLQMEVVKEVAVADRLPELACSIGLNQGATRSGNGEWKATGACVVESRSSRFPSSK